MGIKIGISSDLTPLLYQRAKRENKKVVVLVNQLLRNALWNEPEVIFKGKRYQIEPDIFGETKNEDFIN